MFNILTYKNFIKSENFERHFGKHNEKINKQMTWRQKSPTLLVAAELLDLAGLFATGFWWAHDQTKFSV